MAMDTQTRKKLIDRYKDGYRVVAGALARATDEELDARPGPGKWTAREIAHHLADSDEFARRLHYDRPIGASLEAFKAARRTTAEILDRMTEAEWAREGTHPEHGTYTIERWLEIYAAHAHNHAAQITVALASAKKRS